MRIGIQTWGSEGDTRPFLALAHGLAARGHTVELVYTELGPRTYDDTARALGIDARAVATPVRSDLDELERIGWQMLRARDPLTQARLIVKHFFDPVADEMTAAAEDLVRRADLVVSHFLLHPTHAVAERAGLPEVTVMFAPLTVPSRHVHPSGLPRLGAWFDALGWQLARLATNLVFRRRVNRFRRAHGLPPVADMMDEAWASRRLNLVAVSPALVPRPPDWDARHQVTGFLNLPATAPEAVPAEVEAFLAAGPPPVFVGFGSLMPPGGRELDRVLAIVREAVRQAGGRAIVQTPEPRPGTDDLLVVGRLYHPAVFPRCRAVVHHGGAGTVQTALGAGVPSIVVPHVADQFYWAGVLEDRGVAPRAVPRRRWGARDLGRQLAWVRDHPTAGPTAAALGARMREEDGVATAVAAIEALG